MKKDILEILDTLLSKEIDKGQAADQICNYIYNIVKYDEEENPYNSKKK